MCWELFDGEVEMDRAAQRAFCGVRCDWPLARSNWEDLAMRGFALNGGKRTEKAGVRSSVKNQQMQPAGKRAAEFSAFKIEEDLVEAEVLCGPP